jgi:quercetin dioxygenase-like cupin family protein
MDYFFNKVDNVEWKPVTIPGSKDAFIKWLVTKDHGSLSYAVRKFWVKKGGIIAKHYHKYTETVVITKGKAKICAGDKVQVLGPNGYVFINSFVPHYIESIGDEDLEFFCIISYEDDMSILEYKGECPHDDVGRT